MTAAAAYEPSPNDIAVVGLGLHVPGADSASAFWRNLHDGIESVRRFSDAELAAVGVPQESLEDPNYVKVGAELDNVENFDAEFFGLSAKEAAIMDPQHRHFLECAWEAFENAGLTPEKFAGRIGVFAGCGMGSYFQRNILSNPELVESVGMFLLRHTGNDKDFLATRVSYCFDLKGPSINIQTACSTSLVAVHTACQSLLSGECDMALAGGSTIEFEHRHGYLYKKNEILSPDGHCRAFDYRSKGTIFGSGAGVVALRRLEDALRDGDRVLAIIKGSAVNNDGAGKVGYFAPSVEGQVGALAEALAVADVPADSLGYIECHGTGTPIGDPIEIAALTQAFRRTTEKKQFCAVGSVKTNIGHLDTAAGVVGLSKVVLSLAHQQIPPSLNYEAPNPSIDFANSPFVVNDKLREWQTGKTPRRAGVNSLGVGGTNAHVILEEAPPQPASTTTDGLQLLTISARNRAALDDAARRLADHLRSHPEQKLADISYTLFHGRKKFDHRRVVAAGTHEEAAKLLETNPASRVFNHKAPDAKASVVFMFPGGGAQYPRMGCDLYAAEPVYRQWIDRGLKWLDGKLDVDLRALWFSTEEPTAATNALWERPSLQLPAIYLCEYALAQLWISRGVKPAILLGHSLGENTAGALAGVFSFEDGLGLVTLRGKLFETVQAGGMLSVPLAADALMPLLGDQLDLATINGPELCTVSGTTAAIEAFNARLTDEGIEAKRIPIKIAAHSRHLEPILVDFEKYLRGIALKKPTLPILSNRTGTWLTDAQAVDPLYWVGHLRHTIRFADNIATLLETPGRVFVEVGPGKTLGSLARQHRELQQSQAIISSLRHAKENVADGAFFLAALGRLWACDVEFNEELLWPNQRRARVELPTYPFQRRRYWIEPGKGHVAERAEAGPAERIADPNRWFYRPAWKQREVEEADETLEPTTWLVFVDEAGLGERLVAKLRSRGHHVITVRPGDAFAKKDADNYILAPEHGRDGYDALIRSLAAGGKLPTRIVHGWLTTADESFRPGSSFFHRNQEHGFYSLLFLAQAIGSEALPGPLHISVVTSGMQQTRDETLPYPDKATVLGPIGVIPREVAGTTCDAIDVALPTKRLFGGKRHTAQLDKLADQLLAEFVQTPANRRTALRDDRRYELAYVKQPTAAADPTDAAKAGERVRRGGVYLLTGGLGGIGLVTAEYLARTAKAKLILVGRSALPPAGEWDSWLRSHSGDDSVSRRITKIRELEALGAEVLVAEADVTDLEAMRGVVAAAKKRFGALHGVVHAAGTIHDALIPFKTQSDAEEVFAPKVHGTLVLDQLLATEKLDFFILFSSTSTAIAPAGQVDYVAANAFLNSYAQSRRTPERFVTALNWGVWNEVGMTAKVGNSSNEPRRREEPVEHPLFDYRLGSLHDAEITLVGRHSTAAHWVYDEHRTAAGQAMLPGTGYLELARAALAEIGETESFRIEDLFFLSPLAVDDDGSREVGVVLARTAEGYDFRVQSRVPQIANSAAEWQLHAQGRLTLDDAGVAIPTALDLAEIDARCPRFRETSPAGELRTKQEDHLRFGPRWRVLKSVAYGTDEALAELALPRKFTADLQRFQLHPALMDLATGFAMSLIAGYETSRQLWVPVSYKELRYHAPLEAEITSWVRSHGANSVEQPFATFDIVITDRTGRVLVEVNEFTLKRLGSGEIFAADDAATKTSFAGAAAETTADKVEERVAPSKAELALRRNVRNGIRAEEGAQAFAEVLRRANEAVTIVSSLDLPALIHQADASVEVAKPDAAPKYARPQIDGELVEPRDDLERTLVGIWGELLGVERIGVRDSFFDLGGHSLIAVRLFAQIKKAFHVEFPISVLFSAPTIEACANLIRAEIGDAAANMGGEGMSAKSEKPATRFTHLVAMHEGAGNSKRPLFIVAGMFGNILNLRHLAHLVGNDRPCYGLQARGLYGEHAPHETFEEMAVDYIRELKCVQPEGPYLLAGFSGGGITAYEMTRQLRAAGEEVALLCVLDTPLPVSRELWLSEKVQMHLQLIAREKHRYFWNWISNRAAWEFKKLMQRLRPTSAPSEPAQYHSAAIHKAFLRACDLYQVPDYHGKMLLIRPRQKPTHVFGPNRMINHDRRFIFPDNGWSQHGVEVDVQEVPGDHDSMVLEPNVRTLATKLRKAIDRAEAAYIGRRRRSNAHGATNKPVSTSEAFVVLPSNPDAAHDAPATEARS